jgi:hypothetical protein
MDADAPAVVTGQAGRSMLAIASAEAAGKCR